MKMSCYVSVEVSWERETAVEMGNLGNPALPGAQGQEVNSQKPQDALTGLSQ